MACGKGDPYQRRESVHRAVHREDHRPDLYKGCRKTLIFPSIAHKDNRPAAAARIAQLDSPGRSSQLKRQLPLLPLRQLRQRERYLLQHRR
jgi:hypothetical protein